MKYKLPRSAIIFFGLFLQARGGGGPGSATEYVGQVGRSHSAKVTSNTTWKEFVITEGQFTLSERIYVYERINASI